MKIVIPAGTGQVGSVLARAMHQAGHEVVVLSRKPQPTPWRQVAWDAASLGPWAAELDRADVVINLAGRNVNCRYTTENRKQIYYSRIWSTEAVGLAIARAAHPPALWLQASTATIYADRYDAANDELHGIIDGGTPGKPDAWKFSQRVALDWEQAAQRIDLPSTRVVLMRSAITMSPDRGGIFDTLLGMVRAGVGGSVAGGKQYISWIHEYDFVQAIIWLIDHPEVSGPVNLASPFPLPQAEFMQILRAAYGMPIGLPATAWMAAIGAVVLRTETELILKSRRVVPGRLLAHGFQFTYPSWPDAARDLSTRWRRKVA